jgi:hypothetical protein
MKLNTAILVGGMMLGTLLPSRHASVLAGALAAPETAEMPATEPDWLQGDVDARFRLVSKHLRGFDVAMLEVGHRYVELYWAGQDRNWEYAAYQLGKIETAIANGIERRPKRAASARVLNPAVEQVRTAITGADADSFARAFAMLTDRCNTCHRTEQVAFIKVARPELRLSPVRGVRPADSSADAP